jgi:hypothetical protein
MKMRKDTPTTHKSSTRNTSLDAARKVLNVTPTEGDKATAAQLIKLYNDKRTPTMIKSLIFNLFWDVCQFYRLALPNNFTSKWRGWWPLVCAKLRETGFMPERTIYTWRHEDEDEDAATLDAEETLQLQADTLFDLRLLDPFGEMLNEAINQTDCNVLDRREIFRTAWPFMKAELEKMNATPITVTLSEPMQLEADLNAEADAIAQILNSPRMPRQVTQALEDLLQSAGISPTPSQINLRIQYPRAVLDATQENNARRVPNILPTLNADERSASDGQD